MSRIPKSGYERIAQDDELDDDSDLDDDLESGFARHSSRHHSRNVSVQTQPALHYSMPDSDDFHTKRLRRPRSNSSGVDIKAINARLERWADEIGKKIINLGKSKDKVKPKPLEIYYSVFVPPEGMKPLTAEFEGYEDHPFTRAEFDVVVDSVRHAIARDVQPKLITQGSSGSYFARNIDGKIVGVFKPKDEEPYGNLNPKWTKWLHRNLFPCFFGRSCLIPNLSYVSEAAASLLDRQLRTNLVPYTDLVWLSSTAFHYDFWDRRAYYRKGKLYPDKVGSFQVFLQGFKDANIFLKEYPWPDRFNSSFRTRGAAKRASGWTSSCRVSGADDVDDSDSDSSDVLDSPEDPQETENRRFFWTDALQQSFREELEKLVILDYIMRNTDRGLDNWMVKIDWQTQSASIVSAPITGGMGSNSPHLQPGDARSSSKRATSPGYLPQQPMSATSRSNTPLGGQKAIMSIGAIDNSLAFPWKHPDQWRSFPYGWLFLPVSLIGQPFSQKTRDHFLPLLTSTKWWAETQMGLKEIFELDNDFKDRMFAKQLAVLKGQAFNVIETLKSPDQGPLELTRRTRVHVWDDEMEIPVAVPLRVPSSEVRRRREEEIQEEMDIGAGAASAPNPCEHDLLGLGLGSSNRAARTLPSAGKFSLRSANISPSAEIGEDQAMGINETVSSPTEIGGGKSVRWPTDAASGSGRRSTSRQRFSSEGSTLRSNSKNRESSSMGRKRGMSLSSGLNHSRRGSSAHLYDDDEGDLGFSAAEGMQGSKRKVIVERLEAVKGRAPVFTWC